MNDLPVPPPTSIEVSWAQFHEDARRLAGQVSLAGEFSAIVAVTRGGLAPAAILARELGVRVVDTLGLSSYSDEHRQGSLAMIKPLTETIHRRPASQIVAIDDLADTGATARAVRELLPGAHLATLYVKPLGRASVDSFIAEFPQDCWVHFPWDLGDDNRYLPPLRRP
jgi:xanthine phosphoribosyltransferase